MPARAAIACAAMTCAGLAAALGLPRFLDLYTLLNLTIYVSMAVYALSIALIWGHGGILCFGQAAFFGLGAYAYAVTAINLHDSTFAIIAAAAAPSLFAAALGYFIFYGRLTDVYLGVVTLTVTLILFKLSNSTAGEAYHIGVARLGGFNGMPDTPALNAPFNPDRPLSPAEGFAVSVGVLAAAYVFCKWLINTRFGRAVAAVRENEMRAELLGYDSRLLKLAIFVIGASIAGVAGMLFATSVFVSPTVFGLSNAAQALIWVVVGGLGTLAGPMLACFLLQALAAYLGAVNLIVPNVVLGAVLIGFVLLLPRGLLPALIESQAAIRRRLTKGVAGAHPVGVAHE
jgi:ABC-type branched-subunit amino acid transport system permease subunit